MSRRYNITLTNCLTKEEHFYQLFGNNEWFPTFEKYLDKKGINYKDDYPYISEDNALEITNLGELVQAIDETVFYDIIHSKQVYHAPTQSPYGIYDEYFNFSENFVTPCNDELIPHTSIYRAMTNAFTNSYVFQSFALVQWLSKNNAIVNEQPVWTAHKYNQEAGQDKNISILGQLNPDYKLTLAYW